MTTKKRKQTPLQQVKAQLAESKKAVLTLTGEYQETLKRMFAAEQSAKEGWEEVRRLKRQNEELLQTNRKLDLDLARLSGYAERITQLDAGKHFHLVETTENLPYRLPARNW